MALRMFLACALLVGCARTIPDQPATAVLYRDLERSVTVGQTTGWYIDRVEIGKLESEALLSVCAVDPAARRELLGWLDGEIAAKGGPVESAWRARGKKLSKVKELLTLTRIRLLLAHSIEQADADCPFWIEPSERFAGRQISDDRWHLSFGGGGKGILVSQDGNQDIHFGGAGRILFGRSLGDRLAFYVGGEGGATAAFPRDEMGERGNVVFGIDMVAPVVMRYRLVNSYFELEAGPLGSVNEEDRELIPGIHAGFAFGGRATRKKWFFPGAAFGVSYERTFPDADQGEPVTSIKLGFRVAIDVDF